MNLPNIITIVRIFAVPIVVLLLADARALAAFWIFIAAGVSDGVDGYLARKWNQRTELGAYLDPLADKALLVSIYITLAVNEDIPTWLAIAVVSRDIMIVGAVLLSWVMERPVKIKPLWISKANTAAQIVFAALVLGAMGYGVRLGVLFDVAVWSVAVLTLVSAAAYLAQWMRHMAQAGTVA